MYLSQRNNAFTKLRSFIRERKPAEKCELCKVELGRMHQHLIDPVSRAIVCSCEACSMLFFTGDGKYRRIPRSIRFLKDFKMTDAGWESLLIPINMAFFFYSGSVGRVVAFYPSPAGPTESLLPLESWNEITEANPVLKSLEEDTEALLVNRVKKDDPQHFIAPIDKCYELTGLIRAYWQGLGGGSEVWEEITKFFTELKKQARVEK
ncbi:MAG: DUF5947 family protein [Pyrinomonadaceae bacterium]